MSNLQKVIIGITIGFVVSIILAVTIFMSHFFYTYSPNCIIQNSSAILYEYSLFSILIASLVGSFIAGFISNKLSSSVISSISIGIINRIFMFDILLVIFLHANTNLNSTGLPKCVASISFPLIASLQQYFSFSPIGLILFCFVCAISGIIGGGISNLINRKLPQ